MKDYFQRSAACKENILSFIERSPFVGQRLQNLLDRSRKGGTIYIAGDADSRYSIEHLAEELQVRFRAGAPLGRADRAAVSAVSLAPYSKRQVSAILNDRLRENDSLIFFSATGNDGVVSEIAVSAEKKNILAIFIGSGLGGLTGGQSTVVIHVDENERGIVNSAQHAALHAICEAFEPEFSTDARRDYFQEIYRASAELDRAIAGHAAFLAQVDKAREALDQQFSVGGALFCFGNGGSACDAEEIAAEFRGRVDATGKQIVSSSFLQAGYLTCAVNDGFGLFLRGVEGIAGKHGAILALSTSGKSANVNEAVTLARKKGLLTIGLIGKDGGAMAAAVDIPIVVPSQVTERIQEAHTLIGFWLAAQYSRAA